MAAWRATQLCFVLSWWQCKFFAAADEEIVECPLVRIPSGRRRSYHCSHLVNKPATAFNLRGVWMNNITALYFNIGVNASTIAPQLSCTNSTCEEPSLKVVFGYGRTWTAIGPQTGRTFAVELSKTESLTCFPSVDDGRTSGSFDNFSMVVLANQPLQIDLDVAPVIQLRTFAWADPAEQFHNTTHFGLEGEGSARIFTFVIEDEADYERLTFKASHENLSDLGLYEAYVFNEQTTCIKDLIDASGCANPQKIIECLKNTDVTFSSLSDRADRSRGQRASFINGLHVTLSGASVPARSVGRWFALVTCEKRASSTVTFSHHSENAVTWKMAWGYIIMLVLPLTILLLVDFLYWVTYKILLCLEKDAPVAESMLWPAFVGMPTCEYFCSVFSFLKTTCAPTAFFSSLLSLMVAVFVAAAGQFVVTHWWLMDRSGDRDVCFYNEACYYPFAGMSVPMNNMLSHVPYFCAGAHLWLQGMFAEHRIRSYCKKTGRILTYELDLRALYALALSFIAEGLGSACYHVCPAVETFQFDTCFMIPIAHLCCTVLTDWPRGEAGSQRALVYYLYIITPIWLFNFAGTWYDINLLPMEGGYLVIYILFSIIVVIWSYFVVQSIDVVLQVRRELLTKNTQPLPSSSSDELSSSPREVKAVMGDDDRGVVLGRGGRGVSVFLKVFVIVVIFLSMVFPSIRAAIGGMANTFLVLSIAVMLVIVLYQSFLLSISHWRVRTIGVGRMLVKFSYVIIMIPIMYIALFCFQKHVAQVVPGVSAAESHEYNQDCVLTIYDLHDIWHLLSAMVLALVGMCLLDIKMHSFARMNSLGLLADGSDADTSEAD